MVVQDLIRISVGTEHIDDIIGDFEQSFAAAKAAKTELAERPAGAAETKTDEAPVVV